ncbi:HET-domain-containing protein, partial [Thozetella sp. PMI_491]
MSDAIYSPLSGREIRLLCFNKDNKVDGENRPVCNINTVSLDSSPSFLALSYEWGSANIRENIVVGGHLMSVASNLVAALRAAFDVSVGSRDSDNYLWADAVCINQQDIDERNSQVQMMGSIYTTAVLVICWLPHVRGVDVRHAFEAVKTIYAPLSKVLAQHKERGGILGNVAWNNLVLLARHTYWTRVWMVQEITLA